MVGFQRPRPDRLAAYLFVLTAATVPYLGTLDYPFLHDDQWAVVNNPLVTGPLDVAAILSSDAWGNDPEHENGPNYRPLSVLTLAATHSLCGLDPFAYRVTNLALYAVVTLLVLWVLLRLQVPVFIATLCAIWFAWQPVHTEVVLFVVNREELLCATFWILALVVILERSGLVPAGMRRDWRPLSLAALALCTLLALLSKELGATIPFAAFAIGLAWPGDQPRSRQAVLPAAVSALMLIAYLGLRVRAIEHLLAEAIPWQDNPLVRAGTAERIAGAMAVIFEAFRTLLAPVFLTVDYGFNVLGIPGPEVPWRAVAGFGVTVALVGVAVWGARAGRSIPALGVLLLALAWAPVSHLAFPASILFADRLLFLPSVGATIAIAGLWGWPDAPGPVGRAQAAAQNRILMKLGLAALAVWTVAFAWLTFERAGDYRDAKTLFASSLRNRPGSTRLHNNLGLALFREGRWLDAERHYRMALSIDPENAEAHNNLGIWLAGAGRPGSAADEFLKALAIRRNMRAAWGNLCRLLVSQQRLDQAKEVCREALARGAPVEDVMESLRRPTIP